MICTQDRVNKVLSILKEYGNDSCCRRCTIVSHSFQAGLLAVGKDYDDELILAAFLHDIGHLYPLILPQNQYEKANCHSVKDATKWGQVFLSQLGFSEKISTIVSNMIQAKRYLCYQSPAYFHSLTNIQQEIFTDEGGAMSQAEAIDFEKKPYFNESIAIRKIDDQANLPDFQVTNNYWKFFEYLLLEHLNQQQGS